jgi:copper chaperone
MNQNQTTFRVDGMTCGGCEKSVSRTILTISEVADVQVDRMRQQAVVTWKPEVGSEAIQSASHNVCAAVEAAGFDCQPANTP